MIYSLGDQRVKLVGDWHFVAPGAAVIGDVALHGCTIGRGLLIGINAAALHGNSVGRRCNRSVRERQ